MFRADIGWKKSFKNFFWLSFDEIICQNCKNSEIQAFFGITKQYLLFWAIFGEDFIETSPEKIFKRLFPSNMSSKHAQNDHIYQTNRLKDHLDTSKALPILLI